MFGLPFVERFCSAIKPTLYDDVVDRLNYYVTTMLLFFFALLVSAKQYIGSPIQCWFPAQFKGGWEQYAEDFCFVQNTYFLPVEAQLPADRAARQEAQIGYYQWVPVVLALEAVMFYIPQFFWISLNERSGLKIQSILAWANKAISSDSGETRRGDLLRLATFIVESLKVEAESAQQHCLGCLAWCRRLTNLMGSYVSCLYVSVKFLYVVNVISQFFLLNSFLGTKHELWGYHILSDIMAGRNWNETGHFPRVTMCDFKVREVGNTASFSVQCVLMINLFNEKIFLFIWFWLIFLAVCTCLNFIYWLVSTCYGGENVRLVGRYLRTSQLVSDAPNDRKKVIAFTRDFLRADGVLILKFISANVGDMVAIDLIKNLWSAYENNLKEKMTKCSDLTDSIKRKPGGNGIIEEVYPTDSPQNPLLGGQNGVQRRQNGYPGPPPIPQKPCQPIFPV